VASSKRERELARMRAERQAARRAAAEARRKQRQTVIASAVAVALIGAGAVALGVNVLGGDDDGDTLAAPSATPAANTADTCAYTKTGEPSGGKKLQLPPATGVERSTPAVVTMDTSAGKITLELDSKKAPCTANNMRSLAHFAFYDGTSCHRLTTEGIFVLQCGDPTGTGSGGPGYTFPDENLEGATYPAGTVAMANSGPSTNGSQFFLVYKDTTLPANYTPFGKITAGLDVVQKVAAAGTVDGGGDGKPKTEVKIKTLRARLKAA
jgi:peptidyl-prolyl cis-trans isomerase B (cyclophilin B)